jgi:DNA-binding NtrC family response regulator
MQVLVIDGEQRFVAVLAEALAQTGYPVRTASTAAEGLALWRLLAPTVVVLRRNLPDRDALELLREHAPELQGSGRGCQVILVSAEEDPHLAREAQSVGALFGKPEPLPDLVERIRQAGRRVFPLDPVQVTSPLRSAALEMGKSHAIRNALGLLDKVTHTPMVPVLLTGESGSGKQVFAELLHARASLTAPIPFIEIDCGVLGDSPLDEELFGRSRSLRRGSRAEVYAGAEEATLFFDSVAELTLSNQARLLGLVDMAQAMRAPKIRIVAATSYDLQREVAAGRFRLDLLHRLWGFRIEVPPLRRRPEDILALAQRFLRESSERIGKSFSGFSPAAQQALRAHSYPGNVRELRNIVERAAIVENEAVVQEQSLAFSSSLSEDPLKSFFAYGNAPPALRELERIYIHRVLEYTRGHRSQAARILGISYPTLLKKIRECGL